MKLKQLFSIFGKVDWRQADHDQEIAGVYSDSRKIKPGTVFVATPGVSADGHQYIPKAVELGASALVVQSTKNIPSNYQGAVLEVLDTQWAYAELLRDFYAHPEEKLIAIGITGTNGKSSTSYMIEAIFNEAGVSCGVIGTIDHHFQDKKWKTELTTPDTASLYQRLADFANLGAKAYVMEVSSHALKQGRVPVLFDLTLYTNLTRDHLDYHGTMEDYGQSKQLLFSKHLKTNTDAYAVLNVDDPQVEQTLLSSNTQRITFGQQDSDFRFTIKSQSLDGMEFIVHEKGEGEFEYQTPLVGEHNIYNLVGAIALARAWDIPHSYAQRALKNFMGVPGRLQKVGDPQGRHIFVDYAHTPDALEKVTQTLATLQRGTQGRLITVFGCGGDRDQGKRPLMAQVAEKFSDTVVVTSDNPRSEDPEKIIDQIVAGFKTPQAGRAVYREADRQKALAQAIQISRAGDVILVAGKGHEDYQIIKDQTLSFSDELELKKILQAGK